MGSPRLGEETGELVDEVLPGSSGTLLDELGGGGGGALLLLDVETSSGPPGTFEVREAEEEEEEEGGGGSEDEESDELEGGVDDEDGSSLIPLFEVEEVEDGGGGATVTERVAMVEEVEEGGGGSDAELELDGGSGVELELVGGGGTLVILLESLDDMGKRSLGGVDEDVYEVEVGLVQEYKGGGGELSEFEGEGLSGKVEDDGVGENGSDEKGVEVGPAGSCTLGCEEGVALIYYA